MDELTAYLDTDGNDEIWKTCGWQQWFCYDGNYDNDDASSTFCSKSETEVLYSEYCDECDTLCQLFYDYKSSQFCKTQASGEIYLLCSLVAMFLLIIAIILSLLKIKFEKLDRHCCNGHYNIFIALICVLAGILYIVSIGVWIVDNPVCWDSSLLNDKEIDLGQSAYWLLGACAVSMVACPLAVN